MSTREVTPKHTEVHPTGSSGTSSNPTLVRLSISPLLPPSLSVILISAIAFVGRVTLRNFELLEVIMSFCDTESGDIQVIQCY